MTHTNLILCAMLLAGCAGDGFNHSETTNPPVEKDTVHEPEETEPTLVLAESTCFRVDPVLEELVPTIRDTATKTAARWGITITFAEECVNVLTTENLTELYDNSNVLGKHSTQCTPDSVPLGITGAFEQGCSMITINQDLLENGTLYDYDVNLHGCFPEQKNHYMVAAVLTHEFGHMAGAPHSEDRYSPMNNGHHCEDPFPTAEDILSTYYAQKEYQ